jgi:hypothetical protein
MRVDVRRLYFLSKNCAYVNLWRLLLSILSQ